MDNDTPMPTPRPHLPGPTLDDSARLYVDPAEMEAFHTALSTKAASEASLRCDHAVSLYEVCPECLLGGV